MIIRTNIRKQKQEKKFQEELKRGDWVVTTSGVHGKVFELAGDTVVLETGAGKIKFERAAISKDLSAARYSPDTDKKYKLYKCMKTVLAVPRRFFCGLI